MLQVYPKVIKVEERRNSEVGSPMPTCRQVQIIGQGIEAIPVLNDSGQPIEIQIAEVLEEDKERETAAYLFKRHSFGQQLWGRGDDGSDGN